MRSFFRGQAAEGGAAGFSALRSRRASMDQPDDQGDYEERECEQPASLDPLEGPKSARRLIARHLCKSMLDEELGWTQVSQGRAWAQ